MTHEQSEAAVEANPDQRVAVFLRVDYLVEDAARLQEAAIAGLVNCGEPEARARKRVTSPAQALAALFEVRSNANDEPGASTLTEDIWAEQVEHTRDQFEFDVDPWAPLCAPDCGWYI